jgi:phosphoribosyl-AMP cyclohydrolase
MDYDKLGGLVPAVIQDHLTREVLMVGFMNAEALARTHESGYVTFFSRTRGRLWMKGETSGNRLAVVSVATDCDEDTVLIQVRREGDGNVCHTGQRTCFMHAGSEDPASNSGSASTGAASTGSASTSSASTSSASTSGAASTASEPRERAARTERGVGVPASERVGGPRGEAPGEIQ